MNVSIFPPTQIVNSGRNKRNNKNDIDNEFSRILFRQIGHVWIGWI